jgi:hypothetical protein
MALKNRKHEPTPENPAAIRNPVWEAGEHGPENADHELRKAYNAAIDVGTVFFWDRQSVAGVNPDEVLTVYKRAYQCHRNGQKLAAERWARTAKHLTRAFYHEAKVAYLEPKTTELPYLEGASAADLDLYDYSDTTEDLLNSVAQDVPPGLSEMPEDMKRYLSRGRKHLESLKSPESRHELLRAERIKAAHEYGRVLECMALAFEAEAQVKKAA